LGFAGVVEGAGREGPFALEETGKDLLYLAEGHCALIAELTDELQRTHVLV
jgi:hypothetical protein